MNKKDILQKMLMELKWMNTQIRDLKSEVNEGLKQMEKIVKEIVND